MHNEPTPASTLAPSADGDVSANPIGPALLDRAQSQLLALDNRRRILQRVRELPGVHMRRLARELGLAIGTIEPHLHVMERYQLILSHRQGRRRTFYARDQVHPEDVPVLHYLRQRTWRRILLELLDEPGLPFQAIAARLPLKPSTVSYHLKRLLDAGLLDRADVGRHSLYALKNAERIHRLLQAFGSTYRPLPTGPAAVEPDEVFRALLGRAGPARNRALERAILVRDSP